MRVLRIFVPFAIAAALLAGCGGTDNKSPSTTPTTTLADNGIAAMSATDILNKAKEALLAKKSVHLKGDATTEGEKISLDLKTNGTDVTGNIGISGGTVEIIKVGTDLYIKASEEFYKKVAGDQGAAIATLLGGKWLKAPATDASFKELADIASPETFLKPEGTVSKGETKTINGTPAIALKDDKDGGMLWIATVGDPVPLRIEGPNNEGAVDFTEYGATFDIKAPAASEVVDLSKLGGG